MWRVDLATLSSFTDRDCNANSLASRVAQNVFIRAFAVEDMLSHLQ
jgi:hypothetical protein